MMTENKNHPSQEGSLLKVDFLGKSFKNPIITASGTFNPEAFAPYFNIEELGGVTLKGVAKTPWMGNPTPRIAEVSAGMLNAVGLQNAGLKRFLEEELKPLENLDCPAIVNIAGKTIEEYCQVVQGLKGQPADFVELNISCPNVKEGGVAVGTDPKSAYEVTRQVKANCEQPLIVKLSPNVTDITSIAAAVEEAGADAISMINTLIGMKIDLKRRKPLLANKKGGFSGPAIKPVAVRMIHDVYNTVKIPIIGMGGVMTGEDAIEMMMVGARLVAVGTANLLDPLASLRIIGEIKEWMEQEGVSNIEEIIGVASGLD